MKQPRNILFFIIFYCFLQLGPLLSNELNLEEREEFQTNKKTWITLDPFDNIELNKDNETDKSEKNYENSNLHHDEKCEEKLSKLHNENQRVRNALLRERNMKQMFFVAAVKKFNIDLKDNGYFFYNSFHKDCSIDFNSDVLNKISVHINKEYSIDDEPEIFENVLKDLFLDSMICDEKSSIFENNDTIFYCSISCGILIVSIIFVNKDNYIFARLWRYIIALTFCFSICAEYYRQYQGIIANKMANMELNENLEDVCRSKGAFIESLLSYLQLFSLTKSKSECLIRHESMLTSPFSEINILSVIVKVLASALFTPLSVIGQQSNEFYHEYFRDTTLPLFIVKLFILILVIFLGFLYISGFQIRTWFWTFGPSKPFVTRPVRQPSVTLPVSQLSNVPQPIESKLKSFNTPRRSRSLSRADFLKICQ
uniref:Chloride channel CLIC-like protein 1 n=1 Tax=Strongyloides venezuelensis TaxID=75913 RepID=A0A0K0FK89_STRVS